MSDEEEIDEPQEEVEEIFISPNARKGTIQSIKLDEPIETGGEEIEYLDFRKGKTLDLRQIGSTGVISIKGGAQTIKFDNDIIAKYIERLCALGKDDTNKLSLKDFEKAKELILVFFPAI